MKLGALFNKLFGRARPELHEGGRTIGPTINFGIALTGCKECERLHVAMRILRCLSWRGDRVNLCSAIRFDRDTDEIVVNEHRLLEAIMLANPGQEPRRIRLEGGETK